VKAGDVPVKNRGCSREKVSAMVMFMILTAFGCSTNLADREPPAEMQDDRDAWSQHEIAPGTNIQILVEGGGYYGGANPTIVKKYVIEGDGTVTVRNVQYYSEGGTKTLKVTRGSVEDLARFILEKDLFAMEDFYDCSEDDPECEHRKNHYPPAVPLHLCITIGSRTKDITVTVFEKDMIDYPENLESIVERIFDFVRLAQQ
jgi:hypothetical protein